MSEQEIKIKVKTDEARRTVRRDPQDAADEAAGEDSQVKKLSG